MKIIKNIFMRSFHHIHRRDHGALRLLQRFSGLMVFCLLAFLASPALWADDYAIKGGTIYTMGPQGVIKDGVILVSKGRIQAIGTGIAIPENMKTYSAASRIVTPGLMNSFTQLGLVEIGAARNTNDFRAGDAGLGAAISVDYGLNPESTLIPINRIDGLTRAIVAPSPGKSMFAGSGAVIHLGLGEDLFVRKNVAMFMNLGESGARIAGGSRLASWAKFRSAIVEAREYDQNRNAYRTGNHPPYHLDRLQLDALVPVARGQLPLVVSVNQASDIRDVLDFAKEMKLRLILRGATEAWRVADRLAAAKIPVLLNTYMNLPSRHETLAATFENAARLAEAGVELAFYEGSAHNARLINHVAGNAVAHGMTYEAALAAITRNPAHIWGIADDYGTLEVGKEADIVIWDGDPLEVTSAPVHVFIRGDFIPLVSRQTKLRDRYLDLEKKEPRFPYRH